MFLVPSSFRNGGAHWPPHDSPAVLLPRQQVVWQWYQRAKDKGHANAAHHPADDGKENGVRSRHAMIMKNDGASRKSFAARLLRRAGF
jgi:hypothetical protein